MRIGIEGQRLFRKEKHGMDIVAIELIKALQLIDNENEYFIFVKDGDDDQWYHSKKNFHIIRLKRFSYPIWEQILLPRAVSKYKIDILHCTSNTAPIYVNIPMVVTLHDIIYLENYKFVSFKSTLYQLIGNFYRRWVVPKILKISKKIVTVSYSEKKIILQKYPEFQNKVDVIYNSYGEHFNRPNLAIEESVKEKYHLPEKYFFCLGNTSPKKNLTNILKAYYSYLDHSEEKIPLVLADYSPGEIFLFLNSAYSKYKSYLKFIGYVSNFEIPFLYKNSELFLYTSIRESFGIPILEAMKMGTPVITSNISCMPEIAGQAAYFVDPFSPEDIAKAMQEISQKPEVRASLVEKGFQRVQSFNWNQSAIKLLNIYQEVFNNI